MVNLILNDNNIKDFEKAINTEMDKVIKHFERELVSIRTGRAHTGLVEDIKVSCYDGTSTLSMKECSAISTPDARLILIQPWDKGILADIEKAIIASDLGINPVNDGNVIRIVLPEMSSARRDELVKLLHKKLEDARIGVRNIRKDFHNLVRDSQKNKTISEDHSRRLSDSLQNLTDKFIALLEKMAEKKELEVKTI